MTGKKPLTLADGPMIPGTSCGGKKGSLLPLPFPILDLVHVQNICFVIQMSSCLSEQLLPGKWYYR